MNKIKRTQQTPGPWEIGMRGGFNANLICDRSGEDMHTDNAICSVFGMYQHQDVEDQKDSKGLANARLISAAPELLEALKNLLESHYNGNIINADCTEAEAAIAKATGEA
jgi:hypothetical protein